VDRLFGREDALDRLRRALDDAAASRGRLVLLAGEAGIGKTALAGEVLALAPRHDALVAWATCRQGAGTPAHWPWVQLLRGLGREAGAELVAGPAAGPGDVPAARFRLLDAVAGLVREAAASRPVVAVLDDLQWADESSLQVLAFVAGQTRTSRVLLLGAFRDAEAGPALLDVARGADVVQLPALAEADVARLMAGVSGVAPDPEVARDVWRRTGGNPFFAREVTRLLATGEVPAGVRDVLDRRLAALPAACREVLGAAAVLGTEFDVAVLADVAGLPADDAVVRLERAARARVLLRLPAPVGSYRFVHDLFRETVAAGLPDGTRRALHGAAGEALARRLGEGGAVTAAEVAAHFAGAGTAGAAGTVRYGRAAAADATAGLAFDDACAHLERVLAALDLLAPEASGAPGDRRAERARTLLDLAAARHLAGRADAARSTFTAAAAAARAAADDAAFAASALGLQRLGVRAGTLDAGALALLDEAAGRLRARPDEAARPLLATLLAARARTLHHGTLERTGGDGVPDAPPGLADAEEAVRLARAADDPGVLATCLLALHDVRWGPGTAAERLALVAEMGECAARAGDRVGEATARELRAAALLELGDPRAVGELAAYCRTAEGQAHPRARWTAMTRRATLALVTGDLDEAARLVVDAMRLGVRIGEPDAVGLANAQAFVLAVHGRVVTGLPEPDGLYGEEDHPLVRALRLRSAGDVAGAAAAVATLAAGDLPEWHDLELPVMVAVLVADGGTAEQRRAVQDVLAPHAGVHVVVGGCASYLGVVDHHLSRLAAALGRSEDAARHRAAAVAAYEALGAPAWAALARGGAPAPDEATFRRDGAGWRLAYGGVAVTVPDAKGLHDLAVLLAAPGREVHVRELLGAEAVAGPALGSDPVLDDRARAAYRERLATLDEEVAAAAADHDLGRAERLRTERDFLVAELAAATGLGGRARLLGDDTDRARKAVTARIRYAVERIRAEHPALATHLAGSVRTGTRCAYTPDRPVAWRL
jgi:hypothetical protein